MDQEFLKAMALHYEGQLGVIDKAIDHLLANLKNDEIYWNAIKDSLPETWCFVDGLRIDIRESYLALAEAQKTLEVLKKSLEVQSHEQP